MRNYPVILFSSGILAAALRIDNLTLRNGNAPKPQQRKSKQQPHATQKSLDCAYLCFYPNLLSGASAPSHSTALALKFVGVLPTFRRRSLRDAVIIFVINFFYKVCMDKADSACALVNLKNASYPSDELSKNVLIRLKLQLFISSHLFTIVALDCFTSGVMSVFPLRGRKCHPIGKFLARLT